MKHELISHVYLKHVMCKISFTDIIFLGEIKNKKQYNFVKESKKESVELIEWKGPTNCLNSHTKKKIQ